MNTKRLVLGTVLAETAVAGISVWGHLGLMMFFTVVAVEFIGLSALGLWILR